MDTESKNLFDIIKCIFFNTEKRKIISFSVIFLFLAAVILLQFLFPPKNFPSKTLINIEDGLSLSEIAIQLKNKNIIKSELIFISLAKLTGKEKDIKSGDYWIQEPMPLFGIIQFFSTADFGLDPIKITIVEGLSLKDIAEVFGEFDNFDKDVFLQNTKNMEGYLFPDTYFFLPNVMTDQIIDTMKKNFEDKVGEIDKEILIMASLIEREIFDYNDRRVVSGILWKRIEIGMPLQVDAVFSYIKGKNGERVLFDDLKIDSPYNTYLYKGLTPTPICNPGLDAIDAALNPEESPYLYYLSDKDGNTHFAENFEKHKFNKAKYLK